MTTQIDLLRHRVYNFLEIEKHMHPRLSFGDFLIRLRRATGMLKGVICMDLGCSYQKLSDLECENFRRRPADEEVARIATYYGVEVSILSEKLDEWVKAKREMAELRERVGAKGEPT